jgi:mRNA interferase RelE/StbE
VSYRIELMPSALRGLRELPEAERQRLGEALGDLARSPLPPNSKVLKGKLAGIRSLRIGDYRASYTIHRETGAIRVWQVGHRSTFYKRMQH